MKAKICTTIEQSKKLMELGVDRNTADMIWIEDYLGYDSNGIRKHGEYRLYGDMLIPAYGQDSVPAWSLNSLLGIIAEQNFTIKAVDNQFNIDISSRHCKIWFPSLLDAAFEMVYWLKENNKI